MDVDEPPAKAEAVSRRHSSESRSQHHTSMALDDEAAQGGSAASLTTSVMNHHGGSESLSKNGNGNGSSHNLANGQRNGRGPSSGSQSVVHHNNKTGSRSVLPPVAHGGIAVGSAAHMEAWIVYGALLEAIGQVMYDKVLKLAADVIPHNAFSAVRRRRVVPELQGRRHEKLLEPSLGSSQTPQGIDLGAGQPPEASDIAGSGGPAGACRTATVKEEITSDNEAPRVSEPGHGDRELENGRRNVGGQEEPPDSVLSAPEDGSSRSREQQTTPGEAPGPTPAPAAPLLGPVPGTSTKRRLGLPSGGGTRTAKLDLRGAGGARRAAPPLNLSVRAALADSRVLECAPGEVLRALAVVFGEGWNARMPQPYGVAHMNL